MHSSDGGALRPVRSVALWCLAALAGLSPLTRAGAARGPEGLPPGVADTSGLPALPAPPVGGEREVLPPVTRPFRPGEWLKFSVQYGVIHAGIATLEVPEVREWQGRPVYHFLARAESNNLFSKIYRVRNRIDSYWDADGRFSWRYSEDRHEGEHRFRDVIIFDHTRLEARYGNGQTFPIPPQVQDALSALYFTRFQSLPLGGSIVFDYHASQKSAPLEVRILGRDRVDTPAGRFNCIVIEPVLSAGGIFKNNGRLIIWITDDARRMPVLMKSKVIIGSISALLVDARLGA